MKVLVVDDNPLNLKLFADTLSMKGFEVLVARNGVEALEVLGSVVPDIILLDLYMPGMSGFRFANEVSKNPKYQNIPIIVVSASSSVYDVKEMASYNIKAYLVKPVSPTKLLETIKKVIVGKEVEELYSVTFRKGESSQQEEGVQTGTTSVQIPQESVAKKELETGIRLSVDNVIEGMILGEPVTKNKTVIYREGTRVDAKVLEKLKALGVREVYVTKESFEEFRELIKMKKDSEEVNFDPFKEFED